MAVEINRLFEIFDQNGDGKITMKELQEQLGNMGIFISDPDLTQMINQVDIDGDRSVDRNEFRTLYQLIMEGEGKTAKEAEVVEEEIREAFNVFDKNHDGFISVDELKFVLGTLGLGRGRSLSLEDCRKMINKVDVDGDGLVSFLEFKKMMLESGGFF